MEIKYDESNLSGAKPTTGITDKQICDAYEAHGTIQKAAAALGLNYEAYRRRLKRHEVTDPAVKQAMDAVGTTLKPRMIYYKTHKSGDPTYTVLLKPDESEEQQEVLDIIAEKFRDLPACPKLKPQTTPDEDLLTLYPIMDAHIGMRAWGKEVGEDYDSNIAEKYIVDGINKCVAGSPASKVAIILNGGDMLHADDNNNETPKSKHKLDVDGRHWNTIDTVIRISSTIIELAAQKHEKVIYRALRGNHDEHSYMALTFALSERYRNNPNIEIEKTPSDFFMYEFGKVMIASHHGDKASATNLVLHAADKWPEVWGRTRHRYYYIGHKHHKEFKDIGGMSCEMLRAATKPDSYSDSHSFTGKSQLRGITYHREYGESGRKVVNY